MWLWAVLCVSSAAEQLLSLDTREEAVRRAPISASKLRGRPVFGEENRTSAQQDNRTQVSRMKWHLLTALLVLLTTEEAEALREPEICYVLDGILFVYGIILTFLYCRLKIQYRKKSKAVPSPIYEKVEGVYTGLSTRDPETYTTLELPKRNVSEHPSSRHSEIQSSLVE